MASSEIKVSGMTFLSDVPDDAKIYVVKPGETTPYYTTKAALLADISAGTTPDLQTVVTEGGVVISADGLKKVEIDKDNGQIKISTRPTPGDAWVVRSVIQDNAFAQSSADGTSLSQLLHYALTFQNPNNGNNTEYRYDRIINALDDFNSLECLLPTATDTAFNPQKIALKPILNSEDFTAELGVDYETDQDLTVYDPDDQIGSYRVFCANNNATIGGVAYPKGSRIYRYYDGTSWNTIQFIDKDYVDAEINNAVAGLLDDRGNHDASSNLFPSTGGSGSGGAIVKGDLWTISVAGTLGGVAVTVGDVVRALVDTPGQTATNWVVTENNMGYVPENNNNKTDSMSGNTTSSVKFLSAKGVYDWVVGLGYATLSAVTSALALKADKATTRQIIRSKNNGTFGSHTGNTAETVLFTIPISGGEFEISDWMDFMFQFERLVTGTIISVRFRAGTNGDTSDPQIALLTMVSATLDSAIKRERFEFNTGNILKGASNTFSASQSDIALITAARTSTSLNPSNNWNLTVTAVLGSSSDTIICTGYQIGKTKTF